MSRETDYKERTIDDAVDVIDNSIVIWHAIILIQIVADLAHT
jgi:hypothetical protein